MYTINFWPILVSTIVGFAVSSLWYSPLLFGKEWMSLAKLTDADMAEATSRGLVKYYVIQCIGTLVMFIVLAFAVSSSDSMSASEGAFVGLLAWVGLVVPVKLGNLLWRKEPVKLFMIDVINYLLILVIGGGILGAWV